VRAAYAGARCEALWGVVRRRRHCKATADLYVSPCGPACRGSVSDRARKVAPEIAKGPVAAGPNARTSLDRIVLMVDRNGRAKKHQGSYVRIEIDGGTLRWMGRAARKVPLAGWYIVTSAQGVVTLVTWWTQR
jgi:hypothetical protein